jgi:RNA polymerase sigma-70 factor (ECF subfamily)
MEALSLRTLPLRGRRCPPERELQDLRSLGEAYLLRRFGSSLNRADAEDAVADVVIRLHKRIESGRPPDNLRAAFFTSVRNAAIDQLRSRNAKPTVALEVIAEEAAEDAGPVERAESHEDSARLQETLARMRGNYRETILLRFGVGMSVPEIAERLEISLPAAKKLVLRATEQARKRLAAIEDAEFCPEMQDLARRRLFDKEASGLASTAEQRIFRTHLSHCGSCKTFLAELQDNLHEIGSTMLLVGGASAGAEHIGFADHLGQWFGHASDIAQGAASRVRFAAFKATGALQGSDGAAVGTLGTTAQKVVAVCGAATATTATCLTTGLIGPGIGAGALDQHDASAANSPPPIVKKVDEEPTPSTVAPEVEPQAPPSEAEHPVKAEPESQPSESGPAEASAPAEPAAEEFGFESSASAPSSPPVTSEPPPAESAPPAPSGGGGGSGGGESFGFGG